MLQNVAETDSMASSTFAFRGSVHKWAGRIYEKKTVQKTTCIVTSKHVMPNALFDMYNSIPLVVSTQINGVVIMRDI